MLIVLEVGACMPQRGKEAGSRQVEELNRLQTLFGGSLGTCIDSNNEKSILEDICWIEVMRIYHCHCFPCPLVLTLVPQLMDSSEKQPLKWHYFRSVHKNCVATQLFPRK